MKDAISFIAAFTGAIFFGGLAVLAIVVIGRAIGLG